MAAGLGSPPAIGSSSTSLGELETKRWRWRCLAGRRAREIVSTRRPSGAGAVLGRSKRWRRWPGTTRRGDGRNRSGDSSKHSNSMGRARGFTAQPERMGVSHRLSPSVRRPPPAHIDPSRSKAPAATADYAGRRRRASRSDRAPPGRGVIPAATAEFAPSFRRRMRLRSPRTCSLGDPGRRTSPRVGRISRHHRPSRGHREAFARKGRS